MFAGDSFGPDVPALTQPGGTDEPVIGLHNIPPPANYTWAPLVFAGANATVSQSNALQLSAEVLVNRQDGLTIQWSKVSGPGIANFSDATHLNSTVQFSQAGTYELELTATNNGIAVSDRVTVTVTAASIVNIDQAWLDARGDGPYYLDQVGKTYVLQTDVTTDGTAFAIIAKDITFDLNGHTITYNNAAPITIPNGSFEQGSVAGATGWNFANSPAAGRHQGVWLQNEVYDGSHSLKFNDTTINQHVTSTQTITLEANTTYSLSAMFEYGGKGEVENPGVKGYVRLVGNGLPTREVAWGNSNWRGIQLQEGTFTTGSSAETYTVQVGIAGKAGATKPFYIDDVKVQQTRVYGVAVASHQWSSADYSGIAQWGTATNAVIKNGTVNQGADGATWGHGVFIHTTGGATCENLDVTVHGANSSTIAGKAQNSFTTSVIGNTLTSNVRTITSRDNFDAAVISGLQGHIHGNTINNGAHAGIVTVSTIPSNVHDNVIHLRTRYTNGFAIVASNGSQVHDNTINCGTGQFAARGILISQGVVNGPTTKVFNNEVHVQQFANNQEYEGQQLGGAYGIQLENAKNVEVFGNDVFAYGNEVEAYAFRMNNDGGNAAAVHVHNNTFRALASSMHAATMRFSKIEVDDLLFENNHLITNDGIVGGTDGSHVSIRRNTISVVSPIEDAYIMSADYSSAASLHTNIVFLDTTFSNTFAKDYLAAATVRLIPRYGGNPDLKLAFEIGWSTTFIVKDGLGNVLADADISIINNTGATVATGTSDANGRFVAQLTQLRTAGEETTEYNSHKVRVDMNGQSSEETFNANDVQVLDVVLAVPGGSIFLAPEPVNSYATGPERRYFAPLVRGAYDEPATPTATGSDGAAVSTGQWAVDAYYAMTQESGKPAEFKVGKSEGDEVGARPLVWRSNELWIDESVFPNSTTASL